MQVEIWSDVVCPWCYVGKRRFEKALAQFGGDDVQILYRAFELDPSPERDRSETEVQMLARKFGQSPEQAQGMLDSMTRTAAGEGLEFHYENVVPANTVRAHELIAYAAEQGGPQLQATVKERLLKAHFTDGADVGDVDVLVALGAESGLDADATRTALESGAYTPVVRAQEDEARELGITGVPFFVFDRKYGVSGAQPPEVFLQALTKAAGG